MTQEKSTSKTLNISLWIAQGLLASTFIWAGTMKIIHPESLPFPWVKNNPNLVLLTGIIDLLGGIGILIPCLLWKQSKLTVFAALGIVALMIAAIVFHISRGEAKDIGFNVFVILLSLFVAWGRTNKLLYSNKSDQRK